MCCQGCKDWLSATNIGHSELNRWEAGKAQMWTASVGVAGAVAALSLDSGSSLEARTAWILPFSAGGFLNIGKPHVCTHARKRLCDVCHCDCCTCRLLPKLLKLKRQSERHFSEANDCIIIVLIARDHSNLVFFASDAYGKVILIFFLMLGTFPIERVPVKFN